MSSEIVTERPVFRDFAHMKEWCMDVRIGKIRTSPELREWAKMVTFADVYGAGEARIGDKFFRRRTH